MRRFLVFSLFAISLLIGRFATALDTIKFGVFTSGSPETMVAVWSPLLDYLSREVGIPCEMVFREDYLGMLEALEHKEVDIAEGGPRTQKTGVKKTGKTGVRKTGGKPGSGVNMRHHS